MKNTEFHLCVYCKFQSNMCSASSWPEAKQEELRKIGLEHINNSLDRQNEEIEIQRERISQFMKYHIIIIGFIITLTSVGQNAFEVIDKWEVVIATLPPIGGIVHSSVIHITLGNYDIGFKSELYNHLIRNEAKFLDALKTLTDKYDGMMKSNRNHLMKQRRHLSIQMGFFGFTFGVLIAIIAL